MGGQEKGLTHLGCLQRPQACDSCQHRRGVRDELEQRDVDGGARGDGGPGHSDAGLWGGRTQSQSVTHTHSYASPHLRRLDTPDERGRVRDEVDVPQHEQRPPHVRGDRSSLSSAGVRGRLLRVEAAHASGAESVDVCVPLSVPRSQRRDAEL